jgi:hypothetical protein
MIYGLGGSMVTDIGIMGQLSFAIRIIDHGGYMVSGLKMIEVIETRYGIKYFLGDEIYRANGPAFISKDGNWEWCLFGAWHRYYGPAVNFGSLTPHGLHWYFRGKLIK